MLKIFWSENILIITISHQLKFLAYIDSIASISLSIFSIEALNLHEQCKRETILTTSNHSYVKIRTQRAATNYRMAPSAPLFQPKTRPAYPFFQRIKVIKIYN